MVTCSHAGLMVGGLKHFAALPVSESVSLLSVVSCHGYSDSDVSLVCYIAINVFFFLIGHYRSSCEGLNWTY